MGNEEMKPYRFWEKPATAPLPEAAETICARLLFACNGHPHALIPWPHRLLHDAVAHITAQARRLAEAEECLTIAHMDGYHIADATKKVQPAPVPLPESVESALGVVALSDYPSVEPVLRFHISDLARRLAEAEARAEKAEWQWNDCSCALRLQTRIREKAEARVRELERDNAGRFEHVVKVEAERDALRERCEKLKAALVEIGESEDRICSYCEGEGNRYADGKAHYYSEHAPTIPCPECGGRGRLRDMDSEDMANVANAALAATEVK